MSEREYRPVENFNPGSQDNAAWAHAGGARPVVPATPPIVPPRPSTPAVSGDGKKDGDSAGKQQ